MELLAMKILEEDKRIQEVNIRNLERCESLNISAGRLSQAHENAVAIKGSEKRLNEVKAAIEELKDLMSNNFKKVTVD